MRPKRFLSSTRFNRCRGFTLIELLMVVAIIATLAVIAIPLLNSHLGKAHNAAAVTDLKNLKTVLESTFNDNQAYPQF